VLPALGLLALAYAPRPVVTSVDSKSAFARRYVTMLAFGPFLIVTLSSILTGRLAVLLWGYPLWSFLPLAALVWFGPVTDIARQRSFAAGFIAVFVAMPVLFATVPVVEAQFRDRTLAIHFPGQAAADYFTRTWHEKTKSPLVYITGDEHAANSIAVYSKDRPHVIVYGNPAQTPWAPISDVRRHGVLIVWEDRGRGETLLSSWEKTFGFTETSVVEFPFQSPRAKTLRLRYAIVPPGR
jgi:hypothetical protein